jgi:hypothetical protein
MKMWWLLVAGAALIIGYEIWAAVTNAAPTLSELVWSLNAPAAFFVGFGGGVLVGHLFVPRKIT